jgi:CBS domain containing-hemolysin-like protein
VIEELIGDFDDETDRPSGDWERLGDGSVRMNGTLRPEQFEECTGVALPEGDWQTVAGYVIASLDEIPSVGDRISTPVGSFEVTAMDGYAIDSLRVDVVAAAHPSDGTDTTHGLDGSGSIGEEREA